MSFSEPRSQTRNFAPQVGLAISPTNMTVFRMGFGMAYDAIYNGVYLGPVSPVAGTMVRGNLLSNTPGFLTNGGVLNTLQPNQALTPAAVRSNVTSFYGQQKLPYNMQWNAGIEQAIYHKFTVELKYIGSRGVHIPMLTTFGALPRVTETQSLPVFFQQPTQAQLNSLTTTLNSLQGLPSSTFAQFGVNNPLMTFAPDGNSWYHAGVVALRHRWTGGFQMNANYTWSDPLILLCPQSDEALAWPVEHWMTLAAALVANRPERIAMLGAPSSLPDGVVKVMPVQDSMVMTTLLSRACLVIAVDNGPLQLAALLGIPSLGIFGPTSPETSYTGRTNCYPLYHQVYSCQPCWDKPCQQHQCLSSLTPGEVLLAIENIFPQSNA